MEKNLLKWDEKKELGFYPVEGTWYNESYFKDSIKNSQSPIAKELNKFRIKLVNSYTSGTVLDFGVGCGQFVHWRGNCLGYDVCPQSVTWLEKEGLFFDPYEEDLNERGIEAVTFFDSLEHLYDPRTILERITKQYIFVSLPIFRDKAHVLKSKHFKPREHYWYFTQKSIRAVMKDCSFDLLDRRDDETQIGREDIWTLVFRRGHNK